MEPITFRTANLDDAPDIVRLVNAAFRPGPDSKGWTSEAKIVSGERINLQMVNDMINQPSSAFLLALQETKIVACRHVDGRTPQAYMGTLAVEPSLQGRGIASAIKDYAEKYAVSVFGATHFVVLLLAPRKELIVSFLRRGFQPTGRVFSYPKQNYGKPLIDNLLMIEMQKRAGHPHKAIKILFSPKPEWEKMLEKNLKDSPHHFVFENFTDENIKDYDLVVPLTISAMKFLTLRRQSIANNLIPIPAMQTIQLCDDKYLLNSTLVAKGFGKFIPRMRGPLRYPYILKKRIDEWGMNCHIVTNTDDENRLSEKLASHKYFRQTFIPGANQYATHILFINNKIVCSLSVDYHFNTATPIQGKDQSRVHKIFNSPYLTLFAAMLSAIGFEGLCCIDYKVIDNRPFLLEINPRLGASLCPNFDHFIKQVT